MRQGIAARPKWMQRYGVRCSDTGGHKTPPADSPPLPLRTALRCRQRNAQKSPPVERQAGFIT
ncbi:hypothetical protein DVU_0960 [Nitratidesulfovibrio vulgaris str. Hildenborough]|uniref:Uncharacterized protein n=1 Tax=Nitratidesulfovibrio vulgaris (strain ATCC 29579 / DSM 644 / CCUG 34227 / NCIMB 8303 / VKM B-1760 / Hildenborough) TaxID=882 RepID=Q72DG9_NITV2|nr:hypothetical protein DVU_0960 [Nitratidesulfovibrio vulgaris str. Hildenborough]